MNGKPVRDPGDPSEDLDDEGIPELEGQPPGKVLSGDVAEGIVPPRDYPIAADEWGTTPAEEAAGEPFAMRVARERPEMAYAPDEREPAGRIVQPDSDLDHVVDVTADEIGDSYPDDDSGLSAEEAAMRIEDDPGGLNYDDDPGYVTDSDQ